MNEGIISIESTEQAIQRYFRLWELYGTPEIQGDFEAGLRYLEFVIGRMSARTTVGLLIKCQITCGSESHKGALRLIGEIGDLLKSGKLIFKE